MEILEYQIENRLKVLTLPLKVYPFVIGHLYYLKENGDEVIRIITARKATKKEREQYENIG